MEPSQPTAAPARRRYRRRRPGEPVSPEWTAGPPPPAGDPLSGVLGETWLEYRRLAARLLPFAAAGIGVAALSTVLVSLLAARFDPLVTLLLELPATWLVIKLAVFGLQAVTVGVLHETRSPDGVPPARLRECLGEVTAVWLVTSFAVLAGLALGLIPGLYLAVVWVVCVPVIVIERAGPLAALRRSRQLVRGHGWGVFGRLAALSLMEGVASAVLRAAFSWLPGGWQLLLANGLVSIVFIPAAAVLSALIYYRLTAAQAAAVPG